MSSTGAAPADPFDIREFLLLPPLPTQTELDAVLRIVEADDYLERAVWPFIDKRNLKIDWERIFQIKFGTAHGTALKFA